MGVAAARCGEASEPSTASPPPPADTNGAIVGGLLGALHGAAGVDEALQRRVRDYTWRAEDEHGYERPEFFLGRRVPELAEAVYAAATGQDRYVI